MHAHRPGRAAASVTAGPVGCQSRLTQSHCVPIMQYAVHARRRVGRHRPGRMEEITVAACSNHFCVVLHHHRTGMRLTQYFCKATGMIVVRLPVKQNLRVPPAKPELLHAGPDLRWRRRQIRIDQNVSSACGHEVCSKILTADIVEVVGDTKWRQWLHPTWPDLCSAIKAEGHQQAHKAGISKTS